MHLLAINPEFVESYRQKLEMESADKSAFFMFFEEKKARRNLNIENGVAIINIKGILGDSWWSDSDYSTIIELTKEAESDPAVKSIDYIIDSPGGTVNGLEETARAIKEATKPTKAVIKNMACSAGYWIASQCDEVVSVNESAIIGSIGVMAVYYDYSKMMKNDGVEKIKIVSSKAPDKNLDPATEKGFKKIQAQLDKTHDIFVKFVAAGRDTTPENVNENYGKGDVLIAEDALNAGMIDRIDLSVNHITNNEEDEKMAVTEKTYSVEEFNAAVKAAKDEGITAGISKERARVEKHLAYLGSAKNESILENLKSGAEFADCVEKYAEEKFAKTEINSRKDENKEPKEETAGQEAGEKKSDVYAVHAQMTGR